MARRWEIKQELGCARLEIKKTAWYKFRKRLELKKDIIFYSKLLNAV